MIRLDLQYFGGRGAKLSAQAIQMASNPPTIQPTQAQANNANNANFPEHDPNLPDGQFGQLHNGKQYYLSQNLTIDSQMALINYLADQPERGSLYSMSQNMNYAMANGQKLNANQQFVHDNMMASMHNLGVNATLTRYDHIGFIDGMLKQAGITGGATSMSISQLKSILVGGTVSENKFLSTSYNNFRNAPTNNPFTTRMVKITYLAPAKTQSVMTGNGNGGAFGEIVLAPNQRGVIKDVRYSGFNNARMKGTQSGGQKQIEIVIQLQ